MNDLDDLAIRSPPTRRRVAISGASGLIGRALSRVLERAGHEVVRLVRGAPTAGAVRWSVEDGVAAADLGRLEGLDAVIHLAGESLASGRWTAARKRRLRDSRIVGTSRLIASLGHLERPPRAFLCASAIGFYGDRGAETLDEGAPAGTGFLAELVRDWERAAAAAGTLGARVVHLRFGVVLSREGGALAKMLPAFRAGLGGRLGDGRQFFSWVALDDAVGAVLHVLGDESLAGPVNVTAPQPVEQRRFAQVLAQILHRPSFVPMPALVVRLLLGEMADEALLAGARVVPKKLLASGYDFRHNVLDGALRSVLAKSSTVRGG